MVDIDKSSVGFGISTCVVFVLNNTLVIYTV